MASVLPSPEEYADLVPPRGGHVWRAFNDVRMLSTSGYATLLQVAHPTVGAGVHQYSSFTKDPWGRLLRTLDYVHGTIYGGPEMAGSIGRRVRELHRTIKGERDDGTRYSAMEPDAFAWVHATLASAIFEGRRHFARPLSAWEKDAFWQEWLKVGRLIGIRPRDLPEHGADFDAYFRGVVDNDLTWTPAVPEVIATLRAAKPPNVPNLPPVLWGAMRAPLSRQLHVTTLGLLPGDLRRRLGLGLTRTERGAFAALAAGARASTPLIRGTLNEFGPSYVRWRHEALGRGDVAGRPATARAAVAH